ncbi:MAG: hypothetical protein WCW33_01060 [Candidatus Babeliales bacterium]|jgi:hypothetical protein
MKNVNFSRAWLALFLIIGVRHNVYAMNASPSINIGTQQAPITRPSIGLLTPERYQQRAIRFLEKAFLGIPLNLGYKTYQSELIKFMKYRQEKPRIMFSTNSPKFGMISMFRSFFHSSLPAAATFAPFTRMSHYFMEMVEENFCLGWVEKLSAYPIELLERLPRQSEMLFCLLNYPSQTRWREVTTEEFIELTKGISEQDILSSFLIEMQIFAQTILDLTSQPQ